MDALFPVPDTAAAHGEPAGRRQPRKPAAPTPGTWTPFTGTTRMPCMACTRDQAAGTRTAPALQARWRMTAPGRDLLVCSTHRAELTGGR